MARLRLLSAAALVLWLTALAPRARAADARFDLTGPSIDVRVTRGTSTLDIAQVPNLQPGDKLWIHPDLPPTQSVHYLLICVFLRGTTNPPPEEWFTRIETWKKDVRTEGVFVTVPEEAQQAVMLLAPETGGDFSTLKSAVKGRPGVFVRAQQDLLEAGFEQARIEKYLASIRRVPPSDAKDLQKHSDLLARTLALKPNEDCFKRSVDTQFTCLTQTGTQTLLDDGHGQTIAQRLSNGASSDFINAASYTSVAGAGVYSAYVGAVVDLVRLMSNLHTAQYQYIPAIAFPQGSALNLRLNTPPSFHNPKSVLVIGLPAVTKAVSPPLRPADANEVTCLLRPDVTIPIEGAPLVFSTGLAHDLVLHLNTPEGSPREADIGLAPDAYQGGLMLQGGDPATRRRELPAESKPAPKPALGVNGAPGAPPAKPATPAKPLPEPVFLTGTIRGKWGFDSFEGPTVKLQQLAGGDWHIVSDANLITGTTAKFLLSSTGTGCVHHITAQPEANGSPMRLEFKPEPQPDAREDSPTPLAVTLPLNANARPGDLHLEIQQYGQPKADTLATRTYTAPAKISAMELHAGDRNLILRGDSLDTVAKVTIGDLVFKPQTAVNDGVLRLSLPEGSPAPPTKVEDTLNAQITLNDGRSFAHPVSVTASRPSLTLLSKTTDPATDPIITLTESSDLPLSSHLTFTLKSKTNFPRDGLVEVETLDGTLHATLSLAPSGGLLLQDPHTVVATLDPSRSFGPSAFGALHVRALYPVKGDGGTASDWIPLVTIVRLPTFTGLQCPSDATLPCTLSGNSFFLLQSVANDPAFTNPTAVPDGYTGSTLQVPHPLAGSTLFFKLRDDSNPVNSANVPLAGATHRSSAVHTSTPSAKL